MAVQLLRATRFFHGIASPDRCGAELGADDIDSPIHRPLAFGTIEQIALDCSIVRHCGGDPCIGPRLVGLLHGAGLQAVQLHVVQPAFHEREGKRLAAARSTRRTAGSAKASRNQNVRLPDARNSLAFVDD
jgi:hypothetical protein